MRKSIAILLVAILLTGCGSTGPTLVTPEKKGGGSYEVLGTKKHSAQGVGGLSTGSNGDWNDNSPVDISWSVTKEQVAALKPGMTLEEVRKVLGLERLEYTPNVPASEFHLVCKGASDVTLAFKGHPESKLAQVQGEGSK